MPRGYDDDRDDETDVEPDLGQRLIDKHLAVEQEVRAAIDRGEFDNLPGAGKPLGDLGDLNDPDWWVKRLIDREKITGVLPAALALRKENAELDDVLDREALPERVREILEDFNRRVKYARLQLRGGPPVTTPLRDVDAELERWRARRLTRLRAQAEHKPEPQPPAKRGYWLRKIFTRRRP